MEEAARWIRAEAGKGGGEGPRVQATVHLYRQQILHETAKRGAEDLRSGARIEIRAALREGRPAERRIAARTITELLDRVRAREMGIDLGASVTRRLEPSWAPHGTATVVFAAGSCGPLVHEIGHLFEEDREGETAEWLPVGARIAPAGVTIIDDPSACAGRGSYAIDDEGERPTAALLVYEGIQAGRIRIAGAGATGHARRGSYRDLPLPRMACTILSAGNDDAGEIMRSTPEGIFVRSLRGGSADPFSGRITLTVDEAYRIEGGSLTSPVAECLLSGRAADLLGAVDAVGRDLRFDFGAGDCHKAGQPLPVITGMPTIRIRAVDVVAP